MISRPLRVAVLYGGPSREHGVSLVSGEAVLRALAEAGLESLPVRIGNDGRWALPGSRDAEDVETEDAAAAPSARTLAPANAVGHLVAPSPDGPVDVVFVALHGAYGEDGTVQGLLETAGIPYTGSGVLASALAMDKERTKEVLAHHGIRTPRWVGVTAREWAGRGRAGGRDAVCARVASELGFPVVVKPAREGSSFGVAFVDEAAGLEPAIAAALLGPGGRALVETRISGVEVTCPVLGNHADELEALPLVEIVPHGRELFDFAAKYEGESDEICPARVDESVATAVREASLAAHRILECDGLSRSDFVVDEAGRPWFLEINTVPGMTARSLCPLAAEAAGLEFPRLCARLVEMALQRSK